MYIRRLPIYLLLDTSESMAGQAIAEVERGMHTLLNELQNNPLALETAWLSVITFSRTAQQIVPLTDITEFKLPRLSVRTGTAMGAALKALRHAMEMEVERTTATTKGDFRPLVFLFSDGQPTDDWRAAAQEIKSMTKPRAANIYALGCGPDVDIDALRDVTDVVLMMKDLGPEAWQKVFMWLSASVDTVSHALQGGGEGEALNMPVLPEDVLEIAPKSTGERDPTPRQIFLHARCMQEGQPYLMRFQRSSGFDGRYTAVAAHRLDVVEEGGGGKTESISTSQLNGCPPCPWCSSPVAIACECGTLICWTGNPNSPIRCPGCQRQGSVQVETGGFNIDQAEG